jgi:hypothetical protein
MKQLENIKETHEIFVGNTDCNTPAASGAPITVKENWRLKCKRHNVTCDGTSRTQLLGSVDPRTLLHATPTYGDM